MSMLRLLDRRRFLQFSGLAATAAVGSACIAPIQEPLPVEEPVKTPEEALARLLAGNARYAENHTLAINESSQRRIEVAQGQHPFATIFSCVDSRVPPEIVFDRGLGDLFVIRTAGHVIDHAVLGSLEFGAAELKIPLIVVLGHAKCGAVNATIEAVENHSEAPADIAYLVDHIAPAIELATEQEGDMLGNSIKANVELTVKELQQTPILSDAIAQGQLLIVGAHYDLETGTVELIEI